MQEVLRLVEPWVRKVLIALLCGFFSPAFLWAQATLENPQPGSFQNGIGLISGWICNATRVDIEIDGSLMVQAAYGTLRGDTTSVCGDANNGFGLLVNWNLLGDGPHTLRALKDGAEFARATFVVTTLGLDNFLQGLSGSFTVPNFPQVGKQTQIQWQESLQNFVIRGIEDSPPPPGGCANIAGMWTAEETINATCTVDGETDTLEATAETDVTITQTGCSVSWESPESIELGIPPRTAVLTGNTLQGSGKFMLQVPGGPKLNFTQNTATYEGVISGNRIELSGSGSASGKACQGGDCVNFSCTGTSTGLFTR